MDELALLRDFRLEDAAADGAREHARAALRAAMTRRSRFPRRRYAIALAFGLAAVLAAAAYAIVHQFVVGSAAPKDVQDQIGMRIAVAGSAAIPFAGQGPYKLAGPALIAAAAETPTGPVDCQSLWYANRRQPDGGPSTSMSCGFGKRSHPRTFSYGYEYDGSPPHPYHLLEGYAPGATRIRIGDRFFKTPFGWFVAQYRGPALLTAYGAHGGVVARVHLQTPTEKAIASSPPPSTKPAVPLEPVGPRHVFVSMPMGWVQTHVRVTPAGRTFKWVHASHRVHVSATRTNRGGACIYVDVDPRALSDSRCFVAKAGEIEAFPTPVGWTMSRHGPSWAEGEAVIGATGRNISRVDVRFTDGRTASAHVYERAFFYLVPRANYAPGHRPAQLVGRDAHGRVVRRVPLPYGG
jgi:hypothetical protein